MWLLDWYQQYLAIKRNYRKEKEPCESCEVLKHEVERLTFENDRLLDRILEKPESIVDKAPEIPRPSMIPWAVRKQMLEAEDRHQAVLLKKKREEEAELLKNKKPAEPVATVDEFEQELKDAESKRTAESSN